MTQIGEIVVTLPKGSLRGQKVRSIRDGSYYYSFQGIPYAKPPIGNLRFKAPVEVEPWNGIKNVLEEGAPAPGNHVLTNHYLEQSSEDCLFLNVYTEKIPENCSIDSLRAVLFYIHGGGFDSGSGNADFYSPDYLITENVVIVTCNYRLGPLGFLSLQTPECPGNYGLKDIIMALKWCQENIFFFGGDPMNVTIFGESAGAAAVHYLTLTKKSEGLFHKSIAQSGVAINSWGIAMKPRECAFKLGEALGCKTDNDKKLLKFLREVKAKDMILEAENILSLVEPKEYFFKNAFVPCVEPAFHGALITKHPEDILKAGEMQKIPFIFGVNDLEGLILLLGNNEIPELKTNEDLQRLIPKNLNVVFESEVAAEIIVKIRNYYFPKGFDEQNFVKALSRIYFLNGISLVLELLSKYSNADAPVYFYQFVYDGSLKALKHFLGFENWKGVCHGDELCYLFNERYFNLIISAGTKDYEMMETLTKMWSDFAKTGKPIPDNPNSWPPIGKSYFPYLEIGDNLTVKTNLEQKDYDFWKEIYKIASENEPNCRL